MSQSKILTRALAPRSGCLASMFIARPPYSSCRPRAGDDRLCPRGARNTCPIVRPTSLSEILEPIIGRERIVHQDLATQMSGNSRRQRLVAVELPMRKIRGIEQYSIGTQVVDDPFHQLGDGRRVKRLNGKADVV